MIPGTIADRDLKRSGTGRTGMGKSYEPPKIIPFAPAGELAYGQDCGPGSTPSFNCQDGGTAGYSCKTVGTTPSCTNKSCSNGNNNAYRCITGTTVGLTCCNTGTNVVRVCTTGGNKV